MRKIGEAPKQLRVNFLFRLKQKILFEIRFDCLMSENS